MVQESLGCSIASQNMYRYKDTVQEGTAMLENIAEFSVQGLCTVADILRVCHRVFPPGVWRIGGSLRLDAWMRCLPRSPWRVLICRPHAG